MSQLGVRVSVKAPSNIALIKYMGKRDGDGNLPENGSLSLTLDSLCTFAEVVRSQHSSGSDVTWVPELPLEARRRSDELVSPARLPELSDSGVFKVIRHTERVREATSKIFPKYGLKCSKNGNFEIRTANTFPAASGIASSASSFAALTLAVAQACAEEPLQFRTLWERNMELRRDFSEISRQGSGSSCRSFEGPWVCWEGASARALTTRMPEMTDLVLLVASHPKRVSSSEAHGWVKTSPLWNERVERANSRLKQLQAALDEGDLQSVSTLAWSEFWEMHSLFHTSQNPFSYWEAGSIQILQALSSWVSHPSQSSSEKPPVVTMDAGPNVHVLVPTVEASRWRSRLEDLFPGIEILEDRQGSGAEILEVEKLNS
jgi:diphosphomevalonate decarboxylase